MITDQQSVGPKVVLNANMLIDGFKMKEMTLQWPRNMFVLSSYLPENG